MAKSSKDDIATELHRWAMKEMHFRPVGRHMHQTHLPTPQDFAPICKGQTKDIWQFVVSNLYSAQTVRKVQGNLLLKRRQNAPHSQAYRVQYGSGEHYSQERADLLDRHRVLVAEITSTRTTVSQLAKDLNQTKTELKKLENTYQSTTSQVRDIQNKAAILKSHSQHIDEEVEKLAEYKNRLRSRITTLQDIAKKSSQEGTLYSRHGSSSSASGSSLESESTKEVRECCESIGEFLHKLLQGTFGTDKTLLTKSKESLWQQIEGLLSNHSVSQVLLSLSINTQDSAFSLREKTANIDIKQDAAKLRFKYESEGQLSDLATPPSLLQSVHQLLEESQNDQIWRFMETERCKNNAWKMESRLSQSRELVHDVLRQSCQQADPAIYNTAKSVLEVELQTVTTRCAIRVLESVWTSLKERIGQALRNKEQLHAKYQSIQDFKKIVDSKQNLIRVLVKHNMNARSRLETQQTEIGQYITASFSDQDSAMSELTSDLKDAVIQEVDAFAVLSLPNLMFTMLDSAYKMAVSDLSINSLSANQNTAAGLLIQKLLETLEFPAHLGPEELLIHIVSLQTEALDIETTLRLQGHGAGYTDHRVDDIIGNMSALCKEVSDHDQQQLERILPVIQKRLLSVTQALTDCLQTKDIVQAWWEQPAQSKVTWATVDDRTLQQWKDKWTVLVTRLRQLQISQDSVKRS